MSMTETWPQIEAALDRGDLDAVTAGANNLRLRVRDHEPAGVGADEVIARGNGLLAISRTRATIAAVRALLNLAVAIMVQR